MHAALRHLVLILLGLTGLLLLAWPQTDLIVAGWFYDPQSGFHLRQSMPVRIVYSSVWWISATVLTTTIGFLLASWTVYRQRAEITRWRRTALYLLLVMIVGPGLLVNTVFKDNWGRARPSQIMEFGGTKQFTPPAIRTDQCKKNCSFVSGHASVGFYFLAFAFAWPRRRALWLAIGTTLGLGIGLVRIIQGGHFFSDVIFCGIVVYLSAWGLHAIMYRKSVGQ